jgi:integrase/recombinase XerC
MREMFGPYQGIVKQYLDGVTAVRPRQVGGVRTSLGPFFLFLAEHGIESLESVNPKTMTKYLVWSRDTGYKNAAHNISVLSVFFKWAKAHGHRRGGNPVITKMHGEPRKHRLPRPYSREQRDLIWEILRVRGSTRLRAAMAIGEEAGLRIGEICRLKLEDVDRVRQRLFVGLPVKTNREREALFSDDGARYIREWLEERQLDCGHDYLFHNSQGKPLKEAALSREFRRVVCKTYKGKVMHDEGLESWSTHRLRHTMASDLLAGGADIAVIMEAGGWRSPECMAGYAQVDWARARKGYDEAMRKAREPKAKLTVTTMTPKEFLSLSRS